MRYRIVAAAAAGAVALGAGTAHAAPVEVNLRVEGQANTIYDGPVTTDAHIVDTPGAGPHVCDGTNGAANPQPGPTATGALDDAARLGAFAWDGTYGDFGIDDYFITRVDDDIADPSSSYWSLWIDQKFADKGGCQTQVKNGQEVLWALIPFTTSIPLRLTGPSTATVGKPVVVRVTDGQTGAPQAGATVAGRTTDASGHATLVFDQKGIFRLKAEKPDTIRSDSIVMCVDPEGAAPCTSSDSTPPTVAFQMPGRLASDLGRSRTFGIWWQADDAQGSGAARYSVDVREVEQGAGAAQDDGWRTFVESTPLTVVHYRGDSGATYEFRVTAIDRALNRSPHALARVSVPIDDRDRELMRLRGWKRLRRSQAWGRTVVRSRRSGATVRVRFKGRRVALIGRRIPRGGRVRVSVGGRSKVVRVRGRSDHRTVLWRSRRMRPGAHTLRVRALGKVEIDAVAPMP